MFMKINDVNILNYDSNQVVLQTSTAQEPNSESSVTKEEYKTDTLSLKDGKVVAFKSDKTRVNVYLSNSQIDKIQNKFGEESFSAKDGNSITANQQAETYLSGFWKAAQTLILPYDKDGNKRFEGDEILNVKVMLNEHVMINENSIDVGNIQIGSINDATDTNIDQKKKIVDSFKSFSIDEAFGQLLSYDRDVNGEVKVGELLSIDKIMQWHNESKNEDGLSLIKDFSVGDQQVVLKEYSASAESVKEGFKSAKRKEQMEQINKEMEPKDKSAKSQEIDNVDTQTVQESELPTQTMSQGDPAVEQKA
jgi:hypothetical protein